MSLVFVFLVWASAAELVVYVCIVSVVMFVGRYCPVWVLVMTRGHISVRAVGGI